MHEQLILSNTSSIGPSMHKEEARVRTLDLADLNKWAAAAATAEWMQPKQLISQIEQSSASLIKSNLGRRI